MITWDKEKRSVLVRYKLFMFWVVPGRVILSTNHCYLHISRHTKVFELSGLGYQFTFQCVSSKCGRYSGGHIGLYQLADTNKGVFYHTW